MSLSWYQRSSKYFDFINKSIHKLRQFQTSEKVTPSAETTEEITQIINELAQVVPAYGISLTQLNTLLDIVLDFQNTKKFKVSLKTRLIKLFQCYELIDFNTFLRLLSSFKLSSYANEGKTLHRNIQIRLSEFLVTDFYNFKFNKEFLKVLSFVFNLISIGYIKKNISLFLIYLLEIATEIDPNFKIQYFLNAFKLDLTIELYERDPVLLPLLVTFESLLKKTPTKSHVFDDHYYKIMNLTQDNRLPRTAFGSLNSKHIDSLIRMKLEYYRYNEGDHSPTVSEMLENDENLKQFQTNLQLYVQLIDYLGLLINEKNLSINETGFAVKRRKIDDSIISAANDSITMSTLNSLGYEKCLSLNTFLSKIDEFELPVQIGSLITHLSKISNQNSRWLDLSEESLELLPAASKYSLKLHTYSTVLKLDVEWIDKWLQLSLQSVDFTINKEDEFMFEGLLYITRYLSVIPPTILKIIKGKIKVKYDGSELEKLSILKFWDFLSFLEYQQWDDFKEFYFQLESEYSNDESKLSCFTYTIVNLFENWIVKQSNSIESDDILWLTINTIIENLFNRYIELLSSSSNDHSQSLLSFTKLLQFLHTIPFDKVRTTNLILPPILIYHLYFSGNPILVDRIAGHITYCKKYYSEYGSSMTTDSVTASLIHNYMSGHQLSDLKSIHNTCVMDFCNILWRGKAFEKNEKAIAKGFLLPAEFIDKLLKQTYHHYTHSSFNANEDELANASFAEDDLRQQLKKTFDIFYAPAFASLITDIIRKLEDNNNAETRLAGPLDSTQFVSLVNQGDWIKGDDSWLIEDFDYFRLEILKKLEHLGFKGVVNLLISSLRSLRNKQLELSNRSFVEIDDEH